MNNIFSEYTKYQKHTNEYKHWDNNNVKHVNAFSTTPENLSRLKQKAETVSENLLLSDSYEHQKAEDAETFFQTCNIELMSVAGLIASLPIAVTKLIPFLNKHADKHKLFNSAKNILENYKNSNIKLGSANISLQNLLSAISVSASALFFAAGIKKSMSSQLGIIRKAGFDFSQNYLNNYKLFVIPTAEQNLQINSKLNYYEKNRTAVVDKLKDKVNLQSSFQEVKDFQSTHKAYSERKAKYFNDISNIPDKKLSEQKENQSVEDKLFFENLLKNVEHDVLEDLRKVETISNISYSSLFTGGFLEYLLTDKLVDCMHIKNKPLQLAVKIAVPLITYLILNKNISDIENKVICAVKYKHLKQFTQNPEIYSDNKSNKKLSPIEFIKTIVQDTKEYEKFAQEKMPELKAKMDAKLQIQPSKKQEEEAKNLQKNTVMVLNKHRENVYNYSVGIKSLSETILGPLDILATAVGGKIGHSLSKKIPNRKFSGLLTALGAVIAFIPAAIVEAKLTKQQKLSEKIAAMLTIKELQNNKLFADYSDESLNFDYKSSSQNCSDIFKKFM